MPGSSWGRRRVGAQEYEAAIEALNRAAGIAGEVARIEAMLGWAYFGLKDAEGFKKHAAKARELGYEEGNPPRLPEARRSGGADQVAPHFRNPVGVRAVTL